MTAGGDPRDGYRWWQRGVVYQVYPRSFMDSDGDGVGDLRGITSRLDHLEWLGVDAVWLSPIFRSPMADFGYDISDYRDIAPEFGTLADLDELIAALHARRMKLILDYVPNHTSDRHPWFLESRSSRSNPRRDWYIWRDPAPDGGPPDDWQSVFEGSAWEFDAHTGQYYFHSFLKEQPDLDWTNPEVRTEMHDVLRFWLDRGVDGFRMDVVWLLAKDPQLGVRSDAQSPLAVLERSAALERYGLDHPGIHEIIAELRAVADEYDERVLIGETYLALERLVRYYGDGDRPGLHLPFNFELVLLPWDAPTIAAAVERYDAALPEEAWPNWVLGNHDQSRIASRVGAAQARVAALLLLTLRGTPTLYYGDELGMRDAVIPSEAERDPAGIREPGKGRDPERTPMRWDASPAAGFTTGVPWLPLGADLDTINVERQRDDADSMLTLHRRLLQLRRTEPALAVGDYQSLGTTDAAFAFVRSTPDARFLVACNLTHAAAALPDAVVGCHGTVELSTLGGREGQPFDGTEPLSADEALVVRLSER